MKKLTSVQKYLNKFKNVEGKTFIVTGANSGLGYSASKHFLHLGARVIMACRNLVKAEEARQKLLGLYPDAEIIVLPYDQANFESIDSFVEIIGEHYADFAGIILNAGIYHPKEGLVTTQGFPLTVGTNYIGVYYLLKKLSEAGMWQKQHERRLVFVGSLSWYRVHIRQMETLLTTFNGSPTARYCRSKTALGSLSYHLAQHEEDSFFAVPPHVKILIMHPGVSSTNIVGSKSSSFPKWFTKMANNALSLFVHSPDVASLSIIKLALSAQVNENKVAVPRGLFHISGYPKLMNYPKNLQENIQPLLAMTEEVIATAIKESKNVRS